jgi:nitroreductase
MNFEEVVNTRRSIRAFKSNKVKEEKIYKILEAANKAPSAGNLQAFEIVLIIDKKTKEQIVKVALNQDFIAEAPIVLVFFANPKRSSAKYGERGEKLYCIQDATIAAAYSQLAAVNEGLSCAWVGAFDDERLKEILQAPSDLIPMAIIPIGYPTEKPDTHKRRSLDDIVHREKY